MPEQVGTVNVNRGGEAHIHQENANAIYHANNLYVTNHDNYNNLNKTTVDAFLTAIKVYYQNQPKITCLFTDRQVPLNEIYINLALLDSASQKEKEKRQLCDNQNDNTSLSDKTNANNKNFRDRRLTSYEEIYGSKTSIEINQLFGVLSSSAEEQDRNPNQNRSHKRLPKHLLILGRAGIGKTTLCHRLTQQWAEEKAQGKALWPEVDFAAVFHIPLRKLISYDDKHEATIENVLYQECLSENDKLDFNPILIRQILKLLHGNNQKVLFILDGYDEVAELKNTSTPQGKLLEQLLKQEYVILTSRPYSIHGLDVDRSLENVGFTTKQVSAYIKQCFDYLTQLDNKDQSAKATSLLSLLQNNPSIAGIAHIPINLEMLCALWHWHYQKSKSWSEPLTMTRLYTELLEDRLVRYLEKSHHRHVTDPKHVYKVCALELSFLECLAFRGMQQEGLLINEEMINQVLLQMEKQFPDHPGLETLFSQVLQIGLLKSYQEGKYESKKDYYFVHLTFQEYLAGRCIAQAEKGQACLPIYQPGTKLELMTLAPFIARYKFHPHYELVWWFVGGLVNAYEAKTGFNLTQLCQAILSSPTDMMGFYSKLLLMRCLEEGELQVEENRKKAWLTHLAKQLKGLCLREEQTALRRIWLAYLALSPRVFEQPMVAQVIQGRFLSENEEIISQLLDDIGTLHLWPRWLQGLLIDWLKEAVDEEVDRYGFDAEINHEINQKNEVLEAISNQSFLSEAVFQPLLSTWQAENEWVRAAVAIMIGKQTSLPEQFKKPLLACLRDEEPLVRGYALQAVKKQTPLLDEFIMPVMDCLLNEEKWVRKVAVDILKDQLPLLESLKTQLLAGLQDKDRRVRRVRHAAVEVLGKLSPLPEDFKAPLLACLQDEDGLVRCTAVTVLGELSPLPEDFKAPLLAGLQDKDRRVRHAAVEVLGKLSPLPEDFKAPLLACLQDKDGLVRCTAFTVLGQLSSFPEDFKTSLLAGLQDKDRRVRHAAVEVLGKQIPLPEDFQAPLLLAGLQDKDEEVRHTAVEVLGKLSPLPEAFKAPLLACLQDKDGYVRRVAVEVLGKQIPLPEAFKAPLLAGLQDKDGYVRRAAVEVLGKLSPFPEDFQASLLASLRDENQWVKHAAVEVLGQLSPLPEAFKAPLLAYLQDKDEGIRRAAVKVLGKQIPLPEAFKVPLLACLQDKDGYVRRAAVEVLGQLSPLHKDFKALLLASLRDEYEGVRQATATTLGIQSTWQSGHLLAMAHSQLEKKWVVLALKNTPLMHLFQHYQEHGNHEFLALALLKLLNQKAVLYVDGTTLCFFEENTLEKVLFLPEQVPALQKDFADVYFQHTGLVTPDLDASYLKTQGAFVSLNKELGLGVAETEPLGPQWPFEKSIAVDALQTLSALFSNPLREDPKRFKGTLAPSGELAEADAAPPGQATLPLLPSVTTLGGYSNEAGPRPLLPASSPLFALATPQNNNNNNNRELTYPPAPVATSRLSSSSNPPSFEKKRTIIDLSLEEEGEVGEKQKPSQDTPRP